MYRNRDGEAVTHMDMIDRGRRLDFVYDGLVPLSWSSAMASLALHRQCNPFNLNA
jgi:hypothetical protein